LRGQRSLTADFVRSILVGAGNEGTSPVEKIANPFVEAAQLSWRNITSLIRRVTKGVAYPGLSELLGDFYAAVAARSQSPVSIEHLRSVTAVYEQLAARVRSVAEPSPITLPRVATATNGAHPVAVLTGAGGFFGRAISRELTRRGFRVRGIGRSERPDDVPVHEWVRADLAAAIARRCSPARRSWSTPRPRRPAGSRSTSAIPSARRASCSVR
jgi:hypothetical protein